MAERRDNANDTDAAKESRMRELAILDWARVPSNQIRERFGDVSWATLCHYRNTEEYKAMIADLRSEWEAQMKHLPGYSDLKKKVQHAVTLGIDAIIDILASDAANKDKIAAARLAAQMDGRFLRGDGEDDEKQRDRDSIAQELIEGLKRHQQTIQ